MAAREVKILLVFSIASMRIVSATQYLSNPEAAMAFADDVAGMKERRGFPERIGPAATHPVLHAVIPGMICAGAFAAGVVSALGGLEPCPARGAPAQAFRAAGSTATPGAGIALPDWFGPFTAVGGAWSQSWQTQPGSGSRQGALQHSVSIGIAAPKLNLRDAGV